MADDSTDRVSNKAPDDRAATPRGGSHTDPSAGYGTLDSLAGEHNSAESAGDPGSDDSPRADATDTVMGGSVNSGPNEPGFTASEEVGARAQASSEPERDVRESPEEAEDAAPGDNLSRS